MTVFGPIPLELGMRYFLMQLKLFDAPAINHFGNLIVMSWQRDYSRRIGGLYELWDGYMLVSRTFDKVHLVDDLPTSV